MTTPHENAPEALLSEEVLLSELGWVRQLALRLARDPHVADDVAQDAYLLARARPPRLGGSLAGLRAWLARVTRSLVRDRARGEARRARREACAARPERDDADLVEAIARRRDVVVAVLALREPYRSTLLRYHFEGRSVAEIARLAQVQPATVRQRLVRARAALRAELAATYGDWRRALLPLLGEGEPRTPGGPRTLARRAAPWLVAGGLAAAVLLAVALRARRLPVPALERSTGSGTEPASESPAEPVRYAYEPAPAPLVPDAREALRRGGLARWLVEPARRGGPRPIPPVRQAGVLPALGGLLEDDRERLEAELPLELLEARAIDRPEREQLRRVAEHSGHDARLVRRAELFEGRCVHPRTEEPVDCRIVRMPFDRRDASAFLVVAVHAGRSLTLGAWGGDGLDEDADGRWSIYLAMLQSVQATGPELRFATPDAAQLAALREDFEQRLDEDGRLARALLVQRSLMGTNGMLMGARRRLAEGVAAPADWHPPIADAFRELAEASPELAPVLGEAQAQEHARRAREAARAFDALAEALARGEPAEDERRATNEACRGCHNATSAEGIPFFDAFDPFVDGLELPRGVVVPGLDVSPVLGGDRERSADLARAFRAALLLANEL